MTEPGKALDRLAHALRLDLANTKIAVEMLKSLLTGGPQNLVPLCLLEQVMGEDIDGDGTIGVVGGMTCPINFTGVSVADNLASLSVLLLALDARVTVNEGTLLDHETRIAALELAVGGLSNTSTVTIATTIPNIAGYTETIGTSGGYGTEVLRYVNGTLTRVDWYIDFTLTATANSVGIPVSFDVNSMIDTSTWPVDFFIGYIPNYTVTCPGTVAGGTVVAARFVELENFTTDGSDHLVVTATVHPAQNVVVGGGSVNTGWLVDDSVNVTAHVVITPNLP
jgi:hypothetical protein